MVSVVLGTATRHRSLGANAAIASGELRDVWIYVTAPFVGALIALVAMRIIHAHKHHDESDAAQGKRE